MKVIQVRKSNSTVTSHAVVIEGAESESDSAIRTLAYHATRETPDSCFGATIHRNGEQTVVYVHKD